MDPYNKTLRDSSRTMVQTLGCTSTSLGELNECMTSGLHLKATESDSSGVGSGDVHTDQLSKWLFGSYLGTSPFPILGEMLISTWLKETVSCFCVVRLESASTPSLVLTFWFSPWTLSSAFRIMLFPHFHYFRMSTHGEFYSIFLAAQGYCVA